MCFPDTPGKNIDVSPRFLRTDFQMATDDYYRKMMTWLAVAFVASVVVALIVVFFVMRAYGVSLNS